MDKVINHTISDLPIGIFDSGIGGLTVLRALKEQMPKESFLYLGDTARLPYGTKSPSTIRQYLEQNVAFLLKCGVKAVVVACNSASSVLKKDDDFGVPVIDVIIPGARKAVTVTKSKRIGVIGTRATIMARGYVQALQMFGSYHIFQQACPLLVPLVEEGMIDDPITNLIVYRYLSPLIRENIDTLILGCTHYPILKESIRKVVGKNIEIVDSAHATAERLYHHLETMRLRPTTSTTEGKVTIMVTDDSPIFKATADMILAPIKIDDLHPVYLNPKEIQS